MTVGAMMKIKRSEQERKRNEKKRKMKEKRRKYVQKEEESQSIFEVGSRVDAFSSPHSRRVAVLAYLMNSKSSEASR